MADKKHSSAFFTRDRVDLPKTFLLELGISHSHYLIDQEDLRFQMRSDGEGKPYIHAGAVMLDRHVKEAVDLGESNDLIEFACNLLAGHAKNRAVEKNVFTPGQLRVKSGTNL